MSNPLAVSILSKWTNYYPCDGDLTDAIGSDDLVSGVSSAGYESGYDSRQRLKAGSRAYATLGANPTFGAAAGNLTIGGLFYYTSGTLNKPEFGYSYGGVSAGDEAFKIVTSSSGYFYTETFEDAGVTSSSARDPLLSGFTSHPVTLRVTDTEGSTASSSQLIRIARPGGMQVRTYFVVATWESGVRKLYVDGTLVDTEAAPGAVKTTTVPRIEIGRNFSAATCGTALQDLFACSAAALTAAEISYLYNAGTYKDLADVQADAA